jgi:uncharacterized membrane protein
MPDPVDPGAGAKAPGGFGLETILSDAFDSYKAHFGLALGCFVVFAFIQTVCGKLWPFALFIVPHMMVGFSVVMLKVLRREPSAFSDLFKGFSYYIPILVMGVLMGLFIMLGAICLVIPGIILGLMWSQTMFLLADDILAVEAGRKDRGEISGWYAMKRSRAMMSGHKLRFLGYAVVLGIIGMAGALVVLIGVFITMPFVWLAGAAFYNRLAKTA